jgi:hypothetical protein
VAKAFNRATASSAAIFLDKLVRDMPFKVEAIQVDAGSEFMAEFEPSLPGQGHSPLRAKGALGWEAQVTDSSFCTDVGLAHSPKT